MKYEDDDGRASDPVNCIMEIRRSWIIFSQSTNRWCGKKRPRYFCSEENEDLIRRGMIGLMKAVRTFDASQGAGFAAFAELCVSREI